MRRTSEVFAEVMFFFSSRRRHTRFDCDWSSDVCSSDLISSTGAPQAVPALLINTSMRPNSEAACCTTSRIWSRSLTSLALACDVKDLDQIRDVVQQAASEFGRIDVLINNAGTAWGAPVEEMRLEHWNKVIETNLTGTFLFSQAVGRFMVRQRRGKIINMASVAGMRGAPAEFQAIGYHASKGGVIAFTKDLACKWGIHNIQVNAIAPGWFPTRMSEVMIERNR